MDMAEKEMLRETIRKRVQESLEKPYDVIDCIAASDDLSRESLEFLRKLTDEVEQESRWKAAHHVCSPDATEISMSVFLTEEKHSE